MNENQNQNDFKYLTIALNDHGGYEKSSPKIFENIPTFISGCKYVEQERDKVKTFLTSDKVKIFLTSDDLFFVYSVPHNCKHIETKESPHVFTNMPNFKNAQKLASIMNVDACKKTIKTNEKNIKKLINKHSNKILQELVIILTNFKKTKNLFIKTENISENIELIGTENKIITQDLFTEFKKLGTYIKQDNKPNIPMLKTILEEIQKIIDIIEKPVDEIYEQPLLKLKNELSNVLKGAMTYYEYIDNGEHNFYVREEFNDESNDYFLSPNIDLITTNIGENIGEKKQPFIEVLEYVIREKETNKENQQSNSDCSIEKLQNFINEIKKKSQYSTSELLIVLYIIYEHYERNCFITVNANHCRTCINGGKPRSKTRRKSRRQTRRKIRRNKKAKTKKRKANKKTKKRKMKRKTNMNRKKSKKRRTKK